MNGGALFYLILAVSLWLAPATSAQDAFVYFGTFTNERSRGIYVSRLDAQSGRLSQPELAAAIASPNFL